MRSAGIGSPHERAGVWTESVQPWSAGALRSSDDISQSSRSAALSGSGGTAMVLPSDAEMVPMPAAMHSPRSRPLTEPENSLLKLILDE